MKRLIIVLCLIALLPVGSRAQEDEDIYATQDHRKKKETGMKYIGSYTAGNRTIYRVRLDNMQIHIVDDCWQIKMIDYTEGQNRMHFEFSEIRPDLFLLSKGNAKIYPDRKKWPNGYISMQLGYTYK